MPCEPGVLENRFVGELLVRLSRSSFFVISGLLSNLQGFSRQYIMVAVFRRLQHQVL